MKPHHANHILAGEAGEAMGRAMAAEIDRRHAEGALMVTAPLIADLTAAETFTHPTTPTAADKAAKPSAHTQKGQL